MSLSQLKRWHWVVISIVLGVVFGSMQYYYQGMDDSGRGSMTLKEFEDALARTRNPRGGIPAIDPSVPMVVTRVRNPYPDAPNKIAYRVDLDYWSGRRDQSRYLNKTFIAPEPYPMTGPAATQPAKAEFGTLFRIAEALNLKDKDPRDGKTVLDYLTRIQSTTPISFKYRWWNTARMQVLGWTLASLVVVGGIWPFLVNLIAFGSLWRPVEEKGIDLSKVRTTPAAEAKPKAPEVTQKEKDELAALEAAMQEKLGAFGKAKSHSKPSGEPPKEVEPQVVTRVLETKPLEPTALPQEQEDKEYTKKQDDFYPTVRPHQKKE